MKVIFTWDKQKNKANIKKHGVSFKEASTIFFNFPLDVFYDPDHSVSEDRYIAIGYSNKRRFLMVVHCENIDGSEIRIISARKATNKEKASILGDS